MTRSKLVQQHLDTPFEGMFIEAFAALWGAPQSPYATSTEAKRADLLKVPLMLLAVALFGRFVSLVFDGVGPTAIQPMIAEAVMIAILLAASRSFSNPVRR
jgi:hypothetical protein